MTTIRACATAARSPFSAAPAGPRPGGCRYQADPAPELNGPGERARLDVVCDGRRTATVGLETHGGDAEVRIDGLPRHMATVELWLPCYHRFRLRGLTLDAGAAVERDGAEQRPRWVHFGSSISQGRGAASPSRTCGGPSRCCATTAMRT